MEIGIIGSGNIGSALAKHLINAGHKVMISNSQGPESLKNFETETGAKASTVEGSAGAKDIVIIAIPESGMLKLPKGLFSKTSAVIIDAGNYYPSRDGQIAKIDAGQSESEWVAETIGHRVVKTFNMIVAPSLVTKSSKSKDGPRVALAVAGDDRREKEVIMKLVEQIGFSAVDGGILSESWRQQPGAPAYCQDLNAEQLKSALAKAEKGSVASYRAVADEAARPYFKK